MITKYHTLTGCATGFYKEKGSKFYAYAYPVSDNDQIQRHLSQLKKEHHQARHHCYAYVMQPDGSEYRTQDDGEPKHSAGDPILGQIRSYKLTFILVVVVRYFGGTKLGMGGLIQAYKEAARQALAAATILEKELTEIWTLQFDFQQLNLVMRLVKELGLNIKGQQHTERAFLEIEVPRSISDDFKSKLADHHLIESKLLTHKL